MRAQTLPAAAGWRWITGGYAIFRRNPPVLGLLVISYWFTALLINVVPFVGPLILPILVPGLSVGLMQACRDVERGELTGIATLFGALKENPRTLLILGGIYLVCTLLIISVSMLADGGELLQILATAKPEDLENFDSSRLLLPFSIIALLFLPLVMAYWYAPILAAWHRQPVMKSLFFSFIACCLNWRAFFVYSLGLLLVAAIVPSTVLRLLVAIFPDAQNFLASLVTVPLVLMLAPTIFASFYVSYRDVFTISDSA